MNFFSIAKSSSTRLCTSRLLKFFPADAAGGVTYLKALSGPYLHTGVRFCATGGVTLNTLNDYLSVPIVKSVGGSWIASKARIENQEWSEIVEDCRRARARIEQFVDSE